MRARLALVLVLALLGVAAAGCGGGEEVAPLPETVVTDGGDAGTDRETGETEAEGETDGGEGTTTEGGEDGENGENGEGGEGDPEAGSEVFASAGCGGCHVLADANASGAVGPSLDDAKPSHEEVVTIVTDGRGGMPSFSDRLSEEEIQNVAAYVSQAAGG